MSVAAVAVLVEYYWIGFPLLCLFPIGRVVLFVCVPGLVRGQSRDCRGWTELWEFS